MAKQQKYRKCISSDLQTNSRIRKLQDDLEGKTDGKVSESRVLRECVSFAFAHRKEFIGHVTKTARWNLAKAMNSDRPGHLDFGSMDFRFIVVVSVLLIAIALLVFAIRS